MLTFRNTNIVLVLLLIFLVGFDAVGQVPNSVYGSLLLGYSLVVFYGCYFVHSNFFIPVICAAETDKKVIAISFDDGPSREYTSAILKVLKENNVQASFFCIGSRIALNRQLLRQIHEEDHIIGNHSHSHHVLFDLFSSKKMLADMEKMDRALEEVIGLRPKFFRPPYGVINPNLKKAIIRANYTPIGWSVRSMDTVTKDNKRLLKKVCRSLHPGAVFLFHDTSKATLEMLPAFIQYVKQSGYEIVRLDKMLHLKAYV